MNQQTMAWPRPDVDPFRFFIVEAHAATAA